MSIGQALRHYRNKAGYEKLEVAKSLGWSRSTLDMYERDERFPKPEYLKQLADFYGVKVSDFFLYLEEKAA